MKKMFLLCMVVGLTGCANKNCREVKQEQAQAAGVSAPAAPVKKELDPMSKTALADRVRVYKPDGSLQCGMGETIPLAVMQKQLGSIKVHKSYNKNDGLMRTQVCGTPTGNSNVYEIDRKDLEAALKAGFKEWIFE